MEKMIRVEIVNKNHSTGRGVGFYVANLVDELKKSKTILLTDTNPDIVHYPFFDLFYPTLPLYKNRPTVVTIHDLTPLILKDLYPKGIMGTINLLRQRLAVSNLNAIITDSQNSKSDIIHYFKYPADKIFVTPLAIDPIFAKEVSQKELAEVQEKYKLPKKFILTVAGGPNPNKNLVTLAKVTKELGLPLVVVGKGLLQEIKEPIHPELKDLGKLRQYEHILFPGFVSTEDLSAMYRLATLYCQPSLYEGFGLPVLEAMTVGCLLVSSNSSSLPEIYPANTITFNPKSQKEMKQALKKALDLTLKQKEDLLSSAKERAADFSWRKTVDMTEMVYNSIYENKKQ